MRPHDPNGTPVPVSGGPAPAGSTPAGGTAADSTPAVAHRLSVAITRLRSRLRVEAGLHGTGLSISQLAVLGSVVHDGPVTAAWLATTQHVSPQSIAQNLAVLKAAGLVRGHRDPADGRKTLVTAEPSAARLLDTLESSRESFLTRALDALVPAGERADLERTIALLERLAAAELDDAEPKGPEGPEGPEGPDSRRDVARPKDVASREGPAE